MCKPQGHTDTELVPKQIIGQTWVETYVYVIHFSRLYLCLPFLYRNYYFQTTPSYSIATAETARVLEARHDEKNYERRQQFHDLFKSLNRI